MPTALVNVREAAARLGVHENTIRNWEAKGILRAIHLPGSITGDSSFARLKEWRAKCARTWRRLTKVTSSNQVARSAAISFTATSKPSRHCKDRFRRASSSRIPAGRRAFFSRH